MPSVARGSSVAQQTSVIYSDGVHTHGVVVKGASVTNGTPTAGSGFALLTEVGTRLTTESGSPLELESGP